MKIIRNWLRLRVLKITQFIVAKGLRPEVVALLGAGGVGGDAGRQGAEWILRQGIDAGAVDLLMFPADDRVEEKVAPTDRARRWAHWLTRDLTSVTQYGDLRMPLVNSINSNKISAPFLVGENIQIMEGTIVSPDTSIGGNTYVGFNCHITRSMIGRYSSVADNVAIGPGEHAVSRVSTSSVFYDEPYDILTKGDCIIGPDVWIGNSCIIRRGVSIGVGAVIGANSFVNCDVPPFAIFAGSPARLIGYRFAPEIMEQIVRSKWWDLPVPEAKECMKEIEKKIGGLR